MTERVVIHGREVVYRVAGEGPLIVLVHGMAGSGATWDAVIPMLAERYRVLAPDLPGHGSSAKPVDGDYSLGAFASILRDLIVILGYERATVVGQSLGGGVAMQFAYQFPSRCERLVLVGSGGLGREVSPLLRVVAFPGVEFLYPIIFASQLRGLGRRVLGALRKVGLHPSAYVNQMWQSYESLTVPETRAAFARTLRSVVDATGQRVTAHDRLPLAADIPTLVLWGADDAIIPSRHAKDVQITLPTCRVEIFEHVGHFPHCEDPDRFVQALSGFMASTAPATITDEDFALAVAKSASV